MPSKNREKRVKQTHAEFEQSVQSAASVDLLSSLEDSSLFAIDRTASKGALRTVQRELKPKLEKTFVGPTEKVLLERAIKKRTRVGDDQVESVFDFNGRKYGDRYVDIVPKGKKRISTARGKVEIAIEDLWGDSIAEKDAPLTAALKQTPFHDPQLSTAIAVASSVPKYRRRDIEKQHKNHTGEERRRGVKVAAAGQSYHPTSQDHQNALAEALAIEMKRQEAVESSRRETFFNVTDLTKQKEIASLLLDEDGEGSSEDEDDDPLVVVDDEEGSAVDAQTELRVHKVKKALTKAQRNKKRARKQAEHEELVIRREANMLKSIDKVGKIMKDHTKELQLQSQAKKAKEAIKKQHEEERRRSLSAYEVASVPLSDELNGSLRALVPKGVAIADRSSELIEKGDMFQKNRRNPRKRDNPHGAHKVKWIPKYKAGVM